MSQIILEQKQRSGFYSSIQSSLLIAIDPIFGADPKALRRVEQFCARNFILIGYLNFFIWILIWILTIFLNDSSKPNFNDWLHYRLTVILSMVIGVFLFHKCKENKIIATTLLVLLAALMSTAYSWSYSLGIPIPREFITVFPFLVLATAFRSFALNSIFLLVTLFVAKFYWGNYQRLAWVFTDYELALFGFVFTSILHFSIVKNKSNEFILKDLEAERAIQEKEFQEQISKFVSPTIVRSLQNEIGKGMGISSVIDFILKRRQKRVSVLYCDWRGFSKRSNDIEFIENELIPSTSKIIDVCEINGGISRQTADAILTFFPLSDPDEALLLTLKSGISCVLLERERRQGQSPNRFFVITSGTALIGNMASKGHREFTIMGKPANLSARIDEITKNEHFKKAVQGFSDYIILDEESKLMLDSFADGFNVSEINLKSINLMIRSYEDEEKVFLFLINENNIKIINTILRLNNHKSLNEFKL